MHVQPYNRAAALPKSMGLTTKVDAPSDVDARAVTPTARGGSCQRCMTAACRALACGAVNRARGTPGGENASTPSASVDKATRTRVFAVPYQHGRVAACWQAARCTHRRQPHRGAVAVLSPRVCDVLNCCGCSRCARGSWSRVSARVARADPTVAVCSVKAGSWLTGEGREPRRRDPCCLLAPRAGVVLHIHRCSRR